jgi:hypothetical protein
MLAAAVECLRALEPNPDAVLISGDLADHALDVEYEQVRRLLAPLQAPLYVLPATMTTALQCAGTSAFPVTAVTPCSMRSTSARCGSSSSTRNGMVKSVLSSTPTGSAGWRRRSRHRTISAELGGRSVLAVPSTYVQALLDFGAKEIEVSNDPPGFAVHTFIDGELISHVQPVQ